MVKGKISSSEKWSYFHNVINGAYSIFDVKIELLFSVGSIEVYSFSRTENTITINNERLIRKM